MPKEISEKFYFHTAHELRAWLSDFRTMDLDLVHFEESLGSPRDAIAVEWVTETLSDGSKVNNLRLSFR